MLECPYCEEEIEDPDDCYEPDTIYHEECPNCGKNFVFTLEYSRDYYPEQAPCLNGGEHDWREIAGAPFYHFANRRRCHYCDAEKILKPGDDGYIEVKGDEI